MLMQLLVAGTTGLLIVLMAKGFFLTQAIFRGRNTIGLYRSSLTVLGKSILNWTSFVVFVLLFLLIVTGLSVSIIFG